VKKTFTACLIFIFALFGKSVLGQSNYLEILDDQTLRFDTTYWVNYSNVAAFDSLLAWKEWRVVVNFTFDRDRGNMPMIADVHALHPYFRDKINALIQNCKKKGITLVVVESFRTRAKQAEYFGMGKKYTRSIGGRSKHQYGLACDLVPIVNGKPEWDNKVLWRKIGVEGEKLGLRWGGRWRVPYDPAHFEWTDGATTADLASGYFPVPTTQLYPNLEKDIKKLRLYWSAWEQTQAGGSHAIAQTSVSSQ
jgi:D-alanyl-D-alanine carboxypeptidase